MMLLMIPRGVVQPEVFGFGAAASLGCCVKEREQQGGALRTAASSAQIQGSGAREVQRGGLGYSGYPWLIRY